MSVDLVWLADNQRIAFDYAALRAEAEPNGEFLAEIAQAYLDKTSSVESQQSAQEAWVGMPEFDQPDNGPHRKIIINFKSESDVQKFASIVSQNITDKTRYIWYPSTSKNVTCDKRYVTDES